MVLDVLPSGVQEIIALETGLPYEFLSVYVLNFVLIHSKTSFRKVKSAHLLEHRFRLRCQKIAATMLELVLLRSLLFTEEGTLKIIKSSGKEEFASPWFLADGV